MQLVAGTPGPSGVYTGGLFPDRRGDAVSSPAPDDYQGIFFDIHSAAELVLWSWGDTPNDAPNGPALQTLGRRLAFHNDYYPQQSDELYATDGTTDDTMYGFLGVPSYTIELGGTFFESCSSFQGTTSPDNLRMLRYAARSLYAPYKLPSGPDTTAIGVSAASVAAGTPVTLTATVNDAVFNQVNGSEPVQAIASAKAYLDAPPWASGATVIPLNASDGSFNASSETVTASIPDHRPGRRRAHALCARHRCIGQARHAQCGALHRDWSGQRRAGGEFQPLAERRHRELHRYLHRQRRQHRIAQLDIRRRHHLDRRPTR